MPATDMLAVALAATGALFFVAGSVGLLRFPDCYTRLHALTKADNLGLGLVVAAVALRADGWTLRLKLMLVWLLVLVSSATVCCLIAGAIRRREIGHGSDGEPA